MSEDKINDEKLSLGHKIFFGSIFTAVILVWLNSPYILSIIFSVSSDENNSLLENTALFGDSYGAINTLFSGLAFLGVIYAIILQQKELELTRKELRGAREAQEDIQKTQDIQRFENTFFNLIKLYQETVDSIEYKTQYKPDDSSGKKAIADYVRKITGQIRESISIASKNNSVTNSINAYNQWYEREMYAYFGHYFRHLYRAFLFMDESRLPLSEKTKYSKILRSQFSDSELILIFLNSLDNSGDGVKFRSFIYKFTLLNNVKLNFLDDVDVELQERLRSAYRVEAYN